MLFLVILAFTSLFSLLAQQETVKGKVLATGNGRSAPSAILLEEETTITGNVKSRL